MGKNRGVCVNEGSGYQAPRTSPEPETELLTSHEDGMRVRGDGEPDHQSKSPTVHSWAFFFARSKGLTGSNAFFGIHTRPAPVPHLTENTHHSS